MPIYYVSKSGGNTTGLSWATAFTTVNGAKAVAVVGDVVCIGPGTWDNAAESGAAFRFAIGVRVFGSGIDATILTDSGSAADDNVGIFGASYFQDLTIAGSRANSSGNYHYQFPLVPYLIDSDAGVYPTMVGRRVKITGDSDGLYVITPSTHAIATNIWLFDSVLQGKYDVARISYSPARINLVRCALSIVGPNTALIAASLKYRALSIDRGGIRVFGGSLYATNGSGVSNTVAGLHSDASDNRIFSYAHLYNVAISTVAVGTPTNFFDVYLPSIDTGGTYLLPPSAVSLVHCAFDVAKTNIGGYPFYDATKPTDSYYQADLVTLVDPAYPLPITVINPNKGQTVKTVGSGGDYATIAAALADPAVDWMQLLVLNTALMVTPTATQLAAASCAALTICDVTATSPTSAIYFTAAGPAFVEVIADVAVPAGVSCIASNLKSNVTIAGVTGDGTVEAGVNATAKAAIIAAKAHVELNYAIPGDWTAITGADQGTLDITSDNPAAVAAHAGLRAFGRGR